jgi:hypothetical protein
VAERTFLLLEGSPARERLPGVGPDFANTDDALDQWVNWGITDPSNRNWTMPGTGGDPNGYANGTFGNSTSYRRAIYQAVTDNKATTGFLDMTFDLNLVDVSPFSSNDFNVAIWGIVDSSSAFSFSTSGTAVFNANVGLAILLGSSTITTDTVGWQTQTLSNLNFGTGYDLVVIGFKSNNYDQNDTVGVDNVAVTAVPEPASLAAVGLVGLLILGRVRRYGRKP